MKKAENLDLDTWTLFLSIPLQVNEETKIKINMMHQWSNTKQQSKCKMHSCALYMIFFWGKGNMCDDTTKSNFLTAITLIAIMKNQANDLIKAAVTCCDVLQNKTWKYSSWQD